LYYEERPHGVHVGIVNPGFAATEGFPQRMLVDRRLTRWAVAKPATVAEAIVDAGLHRRPERYTPRPYWLAAYLRVAAPRLVRRVLARSGERLISRD
jgi:short-subunit dehydrogenase